MPQHIELSLLRVYRQIYPELANASAVLPADLFKEGFRSDNFGLVREKKLPHLYEVDSGRIHRISNQSAQQIKCSALHGMSMESLKVAISKNRIPLSGAFSNRFYVEPIVSDEEGRLAEVIHTAEYYSRLNAVFWHVVNGLSFKPKDLMMIKSLITFGGFFEEALILEDVFQKYWDVLLKEAKENGMSRRQFRRDFDAALSMAKKMNYGVILLLDSNIFDLGPWHRGEDHSDYYVQLEKETVPLGLIRGIIPVGPFEQSVMERNLVDLN